MTQGFREAAEWVEQKAEEFGLKDVTIERFPSGGDTHYFGNRTEPYWEVTRGELWMTEPYSIKLTSYRELPLSLCKHSASAHLETELGVQAQIKAVSIAADVGAAFQRLRETGIIKVEITRFTDDADMIAQGEAAWEWYKTQLTQEFFSSSMSPPSFMLPESGGGGGILGQLQNLFGAMPGPGAAGTMQPTRGAIAQTPPNTGTPATNLSDQVATTSQTNQTQAAARAPAGGGGGGNLASELSPFRIGFSLKTFHQDELKIRRFDYTLQAAVEQEANPNGMFSSIADGFNLDKHIFIVDMDDPFFDRIISTVTMGQDLVALGIASVAVNMEYPASRANRDADQIDGFLFRPGETDSRSFTTFVNEKNDRDYRYKMTITLDPTTEWRGKASQIETDWITSADNQLPLAPSGDAIFSTWATR